MPKYEYLTNKDLNYKPDSFEQAKFEYSPLGKVFIDGLDKSDRKEGLLKRLKNIEDKSHTQLLVIRDINRPAIRDKDNGGYKCSDNDNNGNDGDKFYKKLKAIKDNYINEGNLALYIDNEFNDIVRKSLNLEGQTYIVGKKDQFMLRHLKINIKILLMIF